MDVKDVGWEGVEWINLAQNRGKWQDVMNTVMTLQVPKNVKT